MKTEQTYSYRDITGQYINIGDEVYYAKKSNNRAKGELKICIVTSLSKNGVNMDRLRASTPETQIAIIKSIRERKLEKVLAGMMKDIEIEKNK